MEKEELIYSRLIKIALKVVEYALITYGVYVLSGRYDFSRQNTKRIDKIEQVLNITPEKQK